MNVEVLLSGLHQQLKRNEHEMFAALEPLTNLSGILRLLQYIPLLMREVVSAMDEHWKGTVLIEVEAAEGWCELNFYSRLGELLKKPQPKKPYAQVIVRKGPLRAHEAGITRLDPMNAVVPTLERLDLQRAHQLGPVFAVITYLFDFMELVQDEVTFNVDRTGIILTAFRDTVHAEIALDMAVLLEEHQLFFVDDAKKEE